MNPTIPEQIENGIAYAGLIGSGFLITISLLLAWGVL